MDGTVCMCVYVCAILRCFSILIGLSIDKLTKLDEISKLALCKLYSFYIFNFLNHHCKLLARLASIIANVCSSSSSWFPLPPLYEGAARFGAHRRNKTARIYPPLFVVFLSFFFIFFFFSFAKSRLSQIFHRSTGGENFQRVAGIPSIFQPAKILNAS